MAFQVSPGINVSEIDLTTIVPAVATAGGAIAGVFRWGPIEERILVDSENVLVARVGKPTNLNAETWLTAASFLGYGNNLMVSRAANTEGTSIIATGVAVTNAQANVTVANTSGLAAGMYVLSAANDSVNSAVTVGAKISAIVNSTVLTLTSASDALVAMTGGTMQFWTNTVFTALANTGTVANLVGQVIKNEDHFTSKTLDEFDADVQWIARYPGALGNSLRVSVCGNSSGYESNLNLGNTTHYISNGSTEQSASITVNVGSNSATVTIAVDSTDLTSSNTAANTSAWVLYNAINVTDKIQVGNATIGVQSMKVTAVSTPSVSGNTISADASFTISFEDEFKLAANVVYTSNSATMNTITRNWEFYNTVDAAPGQSEYHLSYGNTSVNSDEMHVVVVDEGGKFSGVPGTILEVYAAVSRGTDARSNDNAANYYKDVINDASQYVYAINDISGAASATNENLVNSTLDVYTQQFRFGNDGVNETDMPLTLLTAAYNQFASTEDVDVALIMTGKNNTFQLGNWLIDNIAEKRKDCVVFVSPQKGNVVNNVGREAQSIVSYRNSMRSSSYGVLDSGYKYMYDRYNDVYRWVPLNGDIAGLTAQTEQTNDAWWSPAGFNRGNIRNLVKLAYNPRQQDRDVLYKSGVNPVVTFPGQGTILYGDKTMLAKPSAFDRINVRRLFIVLEKAISTASKYTLFEFNDQFTRSQFKSLIVPYLRDIQGRRGITDFLVVCDETNNTPEVIDRSEFVGDIYIKPARSINYIQLNFVAVRTGVNFSEVVGAGF